MVLKGLIMEAELLLLINAVANYDMPPRRWDSKFGALGVLPKSYHKNSPNYDKFSQMLDDYREIKKEKLSSIEMARQASNAHKKDIYTH